MLDTNDLELTSDQIKALIEREAQRRYGVSASRLIEQYRNGTFDECGGAADLVALARLLPEDDALFIAD